MIYVNNIVMYKMSSSEALEVNKNVHVQMLEKLSICPLEFFEIHKSGKILGRFSTDNQLMGSINNTLLDIEELSCFFFVSLVVIAIL